jgi:hypothetical protein
VGQKDTSQEEGGKEERGLTLIKEENWILPTHVGMEWEGGGMDEL